MYTNKLAIASTVIGLAAATKSLAHTVSHVRDEGYRFASAPHGTDHVQYHIAREIATTLSALATISVGVLTGNRGEASWLALAGYSARLWSGGPLFGQWAPNAEALRVHLVATGGLALGVALSGVGR